MENAAAAKKTQIFDYIRARVSHGRAEVAELKGGLS